jgi:hypothetical protein
LDEAAHLWQTYAKFYTINIKQRGNAVPRLLCFVVLSALLLAAPARAAERCEQALKDTTAGSKTAIIGPKETARVADLLKQAEPLCQGDAKQQQEGLELLRAARIVIGE